MVARPSSFSAGVEEGLMTHSWKPVSRNVLHGTPSSGSRPHCRATNRCAPWLGPVAGLRVHRMLTRVAAGAARVSVRDNRTLSPAGGERDCGQTGEHQRVGLWLG